MTSTSLAPTNTNDEKHCRSVASVLPSYLRKLIPYETFTSMQSKCLNTWYTNDNILISAPTGSGKTVCFELAILTLINSTLNSNMHNNNNENNNNNNTKKQLGPKGINGKIIYLCPTKSLCNERYEDWKNKFESIGLKVERFTGDNNNNNTINKFQLLMNCDIIITTAEKFDSFIRNEQQNNNNNNNNFNFILKIKLLLIDEIHHIHNSRGSIFELIIIRILTYHDNYSTNMKLNMNMNMHSTDCYYPIQNLRIIAVSATIGNPNDIAKWLRISNQNLLCFDHTYRPVPLKYIVKDYYVHNQWQINKVYEKHLTNIIKQYHDENKPMIIFCTSRLQTSLLAESFMKKKKKEKETNKYINIDEINQYIIKYNCNDIFLKNLLYCGIGIHNADMNETNRRLIEFLFKNNRIHFLFSTTTLAQGMNLPARTVLIFGTSIYENGQLLQYDINQLLQMCGRAGRKGYDDQGTAIIMTTNEHSHLYKNLHASCKHIESQLLGKLEECINCEIAINQIKNIPDIITFLKNSFYWVRIQTLHQSNSNDIIRTKSVSRNKDDDKDRKDEELSHHLLNITAECVKELIRTKLIQFEHDAFNLYSTNLGFCMAKYCLSYKSMQMIVNQINQIHTPNKVMHLICNIDELIAGVFIRRHEKKRLNELNDMIRTPVPGRVKSVSDKVSVLLQAGIELKKTWSDGDFSLRNECEKLLKTSNRICYTILDIIFHNRNDVKLQNYSCITSILQICRSLIMKCGRDTVSIMNDKLDIEESYIRLLIRNKINHIHKINHYESRHIATILKCTIKQSEQMLNRAKKYPNFLIKAMVTRDDGGNGRIVTIDVRVSVYCLAGMNKMKGRKNWNAFIIISTGIGVIIHLNRFKLSHDVYRVVCQVPLDVDIRGAKCIDVSAGCDHVLGLDVHEQFMEGGYQKNEHEIVNNDNDNDNDFDINVDKRNDENENQSGAGIVSHDTEKMNLNSRNKNKYSDDDKKINVRGLNVAKNGRIMKKKYSNNETLLDKKGLIVNDLQVKNNEDNEKNEQTDINIERNDDDNVDVDVDAEAEDDIASTDGSVDMNMTE